MLWRADVFPESYRSVASLPEAERVFDLPNYDELSDTAHRTRQAWADAHHGVWPNMPLPYPPDTPRPRIQLPAADWAPDILHIRDLNILVSARMRYAMGLRSDEVQYLPIELIDGSDAAYQQDYKWMAWNVTRPAIDMERSEYTWEDSLDDLSHPRVDTMTNLVWREDAEEGAGLFWCAEYPSYLLATETLAWRVDRAGCTGIRFEKLRDIRLFSTKPRTYRPRSYTPEW